MTERARVFEGVAPLHAARTSQRDVPATTLTVLYRSKDGQMSRVFTNRSQLVGLRRSFVVKIPSWEASGVGRFMGSDARTRRIPNPKQETESSGGLVLFTADDGF